MSIHVSASTDRQARPRWSHAISLIDGVASTYSATRTQSNGTELTIAISLRSPSYIIFSTLLLVCYLVIAVSLTWNWQSRHRVLVRSDNVHPHQHAEKLWKKKRKIIINKRQCNLLFFENKTSNTYSTVRR